MNKEDIFDSIANKKILLIEGDEFVRDALEIVFSDRVQQFVTAESAEIGLDILKLKNFEVIICDYWLQGLNGIQFFEKACLPNDVFKVLITAFIGVDDLISEAQRLGISEIVEKPFSPEAVVRFLSYSFC